jgi:hypothetical protein
LGVAGGNRVGGPPRDRAAAEARLALRAECRTPLFHRDKFRFLSSYPLNQISLNETGREK